MNELDPSGIDWEQVPARKLSEFQILAADMGIIAGEWANHDLLMKQFLFQAILSAFIVLLGYYLGVSVLVLVFMVLGGMAARGAVHQGLTALKMTRFEKKFALQAMFLSRLQTQFPLQKKEE